ncbi:MAG: hypothetical protein AAF725_07825 [Acidobacteriota bacterium]
MLTLAALALTSALLTSPNWPTSTDLPLSKLFRAGPQPVGAQIFAHPNSQAPDAGPGISTDPMGPSSGSSSPGKAQVGQFCTDLQLQSNPPNRQFGVVAESTCSQCAEAAFVPAEGFFVARESYLTEVILWGTYLPLDEPPPAETWTVTIHGQDSLVQATQPEFVLSRQVLTKLSREATGEVSLENNEYRWRLRLNEPVYLARAGYYWIEAFHDSPTATTDAVLGSAPLQIGNGAEGFAVSRTAPGALWEILPQFDIALEACGFDAGWGGLIVPGFRIDESNPDDTTLFAVRNTNTLSGRTVRVSYYGDSFSDGPLRVDEIELNPGQTLPVNVGLVSGLDFDGEPVSSGFIIISEADGTWDDLEGDFSRVDFANDFAAGSRMIEADEFCRKQEIRVVDFGSGSDFNVLLREGVFSPQAAMTVTILDEAGNLVAEEEVAGNGYNLRKIAIEELTEDLSFGTLIFDFGGSGGGVVTGRYSAFGRFSTEVNGVCRD